MKTRNGLAELIADIKEQVLYLQELGVETFDGRFSEFKSSKLTVDSSKSAEKYVPAELPTVSVRKPVVIHAQSKRVSLAELPSLPKRNIANPNPDQGNADGPGEIEMPKAKAKLKPEETLFDAPAETLPEAYETIADIHLDIGNCTRCPLHQGRTKIVHSVGTLEADLMFVGEAPGADEDAQGEPFVGRAGQLLNKIIESIGMKREDVCIGNINRCRPPGNRQPTLPEAHTCRPFLLREIAVIRPKVIVVMGNTALHNLLDTKIGISKMRGEFHDYFGVKVMPTFHPAYLLRDPSKKREVWEDMKKVRDFLAAA